jgi:Holliday junction resolvase-like predicted endonuclease
MMIKNLSVRLATKKLIKYLKNYSMDDFLPHFLYHIHQLQTRYILDLDGECFYFENILVFVTLNVDFLKGEKSNQRYKPEYIMDLIGVIYKDDWGSENFYIFNSETMTTLKQYSNQRYYNRRRVSEIYREYSYNVLSEFNSSIFSKFNFSVDTYFKTIAYIYYFSLGKSEDHTTFGYIDENELFEVIHDDEFYHIIDFLKDRDSKFKLYEVNNRLYCSDFTLFEDNIFSLIASKFDDNSNNFGVYCGKTFEQFCSKSLSKLFKIYRNVEIDGLEIDILCEFGDMLIIVEAKSRVYDFNQKEDDLQRDNTKRKLRKGKKQLSKILDKIDEGCNFKVKGKILEISKRKIRYRIPLIITLEDHFQDNNYGYSKDIHDRTGFIPTCISIDELDGIIDNSPTPYHFVSYFNQRIFTTSTKYYQLDKFVDFISINKRLKGEQEYGPYFQNVIRDYFSINRALRRKGETDRYVYKDKIIPAVINILIMIESTKYSNYNTLLMLLLPSFRMITSEDNLFERDYKLNLMEKYIKRDILTVKFVKTHKPPKRGYIWIVIESGHFIEIIGDNIDAY